MAIGGAVKGGLYGTAPTLAKNGNPLLSNSGNDVRWDIDFRRIYAQILDKWLGADSAAILGGDFRQPGIDFL
jgi:uncharacterized protein (DUF1501 family)